MLDKPWSLTHIQGENKEACQVYDPQRETYEGPHTSATTTASQQAATRHRGKVTGFLNGPDRKTLPKRTKQ